MAAGFPSSPFAISKNDLSLNHASNCSPSPNIFPNRSPLVDPGSVTEFGFDHHIAFIIDSVCTGGVQHQSSVWAPIMILTRLGKSPRKITSALNPTAGDPLLDVSFLLSAAKEPTGRRISKANKDFLGRCRSPYSLKGRLAIGRELATRPTPLRLVPQFLLIHLRIRALQDFGDGLAGPPRRHADGRAQADAVLGLAATKHELRR